MNSLKRVALLLAVFAVLVVFSVGYTGNDILQRAIVLGIGVDLCEEGVNVTAEIVSPGNGSEEVGTFSKTISASGKTVAMALQKISQLSGKETSLGQCVLLVYGQEMMQSDFSSTADFFTRSDSFKESSVVCCCQGNAEELLNRGDALKKSVSISLADKLKGLSQDVAIPSCDLLTFARSQAELYRTGFLNFVRFVPSQNSDGDNPNQAQGYFVCDRVAVFRQNKLVTVLSERETQGFAVLSQKASGNVFAVESDGKLLTLRANSKKVDASKKGSGVVFSVDMQVKLARTDSFGASGVFTAKTQSEISSDMLFEAQRQAEEVARLFLARQRECEFDLLNIHEMFRQAYGTTQYVCNLPMKDIPVELNVTVREK